MGLSILPPITAGAKTKVKTKAMGNSIRRLKLLLRIGQSKGQEDQAETEHG